MTPDEIIHVLEPAPTTGTLEALTEPHWATSGRAFAVRRTHRSARGFSMNLRILTAAVALAAVSIAVRAVGVANQAVVSNHFGTGEAMDAYFAVLALPTLLVNLATGALEAALIPVYVRLSTEGRTREASEVLSTLLNVLILVTGALTIALLLWPQPTVRLLAPGIQQRTEDIGVALAPLIFPTLFLNVVAGFLTSVLNAKRRFAVPAVAAIFVPIVSLVAVIALGAVLGVTALGVGLLVGTVIQLAVLLALTTGTGLRYRPVLHLGNPDVLRALHQFWPMLVGSAIGLANPVVDQAVASLLGGGKISALNYALKVISVPVTVIFMATSRAVLPQFSSQAAERDFASLKQTLRLFAWLSGFASLVASIALTVLAYQTVDLLFHRGAFTTRDTVLTAQVVAGFAVGLIPMALGFMIPRVYSALHRNDILMKIAVFTLILNAALDVLLASILGLPGIALGTSIDYLLTLVVQLAILRGLIGPLNLLTPPVREFQALLRGVRRASHGEQPSTRREALSLPQVHGLRTIASDLAIALTGFAVVAAVVAHDAIQGLRLSISAALAVVFWRSPLLLVCTWAALGAFYDVYLGDHSLGFILALASLPVFAVALWREWTSRTPHTWAIWTFTLLLVWLLLGARRTPLGLSQFGIDELGLIDYLAVMLVAIRYLTTRRRFERFVTILLATSTVIAVISLLEYFLRFGGHHDAGADLIYRVGGVFGWSNSLGFYLDLVLPFALYRLVTASREARQVWAIVLALDAIALGLTFGRSVIICAIISVVVAAVLLSGRQGVWMIRGAVGFVLVVIALLFVPRLHLGQRIFAGVTTLNARTYAWGTLVQNLNVRDPIGHGWFASFSLLTTVLPGGVGAPHNVYLQMLYDTGIPGFLLFAATLVLLISGAWRRTLRSRGHMRIASALATGGLVAAAVYCALGTELWDFALGIYFWILAAIPYLPLADPLPPPSAASIRTATDAREHARGAIPNSGTLVQAVSIGREESLAAGAGMDNVR